VITHNFARGRESAVIVMKSNKRGAYCAKSSAIPKQILGGGGRGGGVVGELPNIKNRAPWGEGLKFLKDGKKGDGLNELLRREPFSPAGLAE